MKRLVAYVVLTAWVSHAAAYEFSTHAAVTREAYLRSNLNPSAGDVLRRLGLTDRQVNLGDVYVDVSKNGATTRLRAPLDQPNFAATKINNANRESPSGFTPAEGVLAAWLMLGAIREDDVPYDSRNDDNTPQDDPNGASARVLNHFFDPKYDAPLVVFPLITMRARDWALGVSGVQTGNSFDLPSAKEAMWRAATLTMKDSSGNVVPVGLPADFPFFTRTSAQREALRNAYWATTFRALGSAVHLLQDMAQPQHTRNDPHSGMGCYVFNQCFYGHASFYEQYVEARATGQPVFTLKERDGLFSPFMQTTVPTSAPPLNYSGYTPVKLSGYRDYFASIAGAGSESGLGLANYSNQGFYTAGSNIGSSRAGNYVSPPPSGNDPRLRDVTLVNVVDTSGSPVQGSITLKKGAVADYNDSSSTDGADVALSSYGAFDQFVAAKGSRSYTLNHYNYEDQARLLIPRAVAYSAGFLNRFFRGRLDIQMPDEGAYGVSDQSCASACGFRRLKLKVRNATPSEDLSSGLFVASVLYRTYSSYQPDLSAQPGSPNFVGFPARSLDEEMTVSNKVAVSTLPSGSARDLTFDFPDPIPLNATDITVQVAYRGALGNEADAVIVSNKDISEPSFFAFANVTDFVWDINGQRFMPLPFAGVSAPEDVLDLKVRFNTAASGALATIPRLSVKQHGQLAVLTDLGTPTMYVDYRTPSPLQTYPTIPAQFPATEFYSPANTIGYDASVKVSLRRGVYRQNYMSFGWPRDDIVFCQTGYERCTQSTLPALSPADRVNWTVTF